MSKNYEESLEQMKNLVIYRDLTKDKVVQAWQNQNEGPYDFSFVLSCAAAKTGLSGKIWPDYLLDIILTDDNIFSRSSAYVDWKQLNFQIKAAAVEELAVLQGVARNIWPRNGAAYSQTVLDLLENFKMPDVLPQFGALYIREREKIADDFTALAPMELAERLAGFHKKLGFGSQVCFTAYRWANHLTGIPQPDPVTLDTLIGYEYQKQIICENTEAFLNHGIANNLLLYGERGTGKSSTIKAVINKYAEQGLRIVELPRQHIDEFPQLVAQLVGEPLHYIIFMDDLSFDKDETEYKHFKALMEGGVANVPKNILMYATSNRRHLVQETWEDRPTSAQEVHLKDNMSEKLSLADRFGVTITFASPDQEQYLDIVMGIAEQEGVEMPTEELRRQALQWAVWYNARSGRTARQFINSLLGKTE